MINQKCPICSFDGLHNVDKFYPTYKIDGCCFDLLKCSKCNHYYTFFYSDIETNRYYDSGDYKVQDTRGSIFHKIQEFEYKKVLRKIEKYITNKDLMDFGCGKGVFLSSAMQMGFDVAGVETSKPRADYARNIFDIEVDSRTYVDGKIFDRQFSIITLFHVLEHLPEAKTLLKNLLHDNHKLDGVVVLEVPNFDSWQSKIAKEHWLHVDMPRHLSHFTPSSIEGVIGDLNYIVLKKETISLHLGIIGMLQSIMSVFGYRGFLIGELKHKRTKSLVIKILLLLPVSFLLEIISGIFNKGGVLRYYIKRKA